MSRRSSRLISKRVLTSSDTVDALLPDNDSDYLEENSGNDGPQVSKPKRKKQRIADIEPSSSRPGQKDRRRGGKLQQLQEMPLDILYDIFSHLRPLDLLRLVWTTKALRNILMQRSAIGVWKDARRNVEGLPECFSGLTEPQYAKLVFDTHCHFCDSQGAQAILWAFRARSCRDCLYGKFIENPHIFGMDDDVLTSLLLYATVHKNKCRVRIYRQADVIAVETFLDSLRYEETGDDNDDEDDDLEDDNSEDVDPREEQFVRSRMSEVAALQSQIKPYEEWYQGIQSNRTQELGSIREQRKDAAMGKLREMGYGFELDNMRYRDLEKLTKHSSFRKAQKLSERVWDSIKQPLIDIVEKVRQERLKAEYDVVLVKRQMVVDSLLSDYVLQQPVNEIIPGTGDVCQMEEFKTIIFDTPADVEVDAQSFQQVMAHLPQIIIKWRASRDIWLWRVLNVNLDSTISQPDLTQLNLVSTLFICWECSTPISYPRVLAHNCRAGPHLFCIFRSSSSNTYPESVLWAREDMLPWNYIRRFSIGYTETRSKVIGQQAKEIAGICGLDPDTATFEQMNELDPRLECTACVSDIDGRPIMDWSNALRHIHSNHSNSWSSFTKHYKPSNTSTSALRLVNSAETETVKGIELHQEAQKTDDTRKDEVGCIRCRKKFDFSQFGRHLKEKHDVDQISKDEYYRHIDQTQPFSSVFLPLDIKTI